MKKKYVTIIIVASILVVLAGSLVLINHSKKNNIKRIKRPEIL